MPEAPWYRDGLAFQCRACGACCGGFPGYVWVTDAEIAAMAAALSLGPEEFASRYVTTRGGRRTLAEAGDYDCVMLGPDGRCAVYASRPLQCRTFPFWSSNLRTRAAWRAAGRRCPGIGSGPVVTFEEIERARLAR